MNPSDKADAELIEGTRNGDDFIIHVKGRWDGLARVPAAPDINLPECGCVRFNAEELETWNSLLPVFAVRTAEYCERHNLRIDLSGLPEGVKGLLALAAAVPERTDVSPLASPKGILATAGAWALEMGVQCRGVLEFLGELSFAVAAMFRGKARFRRVDFLEAISESGPQALGIIALISILVGTILAFLGAVQLKMFGAEIFVANLVGIGMVREMGALMTAIIMTGRTGAAFAARLGTMQVNEEVDALRTMAFNPMEFLVLPRVAAMCLMMPVLTVYATALGIFGGAIIGVGMLDITPMQYYVQMQSGMKLAGIAAGLIKSVVFGVLVALCGCLHGIRCGRSAMAVGEATTRAVVSGIVAIIVADSLLNVIYIIVGI